MRMDQVELIVLSCEDIANLLQISTNYVNELVRDQGFPKATYNQYPMVEFIRKYISYQMDLNKNKIKKMKEELSEAKPRFDIAAARLKELELEEKEGSLVPVSKVKEFTLNRAILYTKSLDALKTKLNPLLSEAKTPKEIDKILTKEIDRIKNQVADIPPDIQAEQIKFD